MVGRGRGTVAGVVLGATVWAVLVIGQDRIDTTWGVVVGAILAVLGAGVLALLRVRSRSFATALATSAALTLVVPLAALYFFVLVVIDAY